MTYWHTIKLDENTAQSKIHATIEIGPDSQWFSGHFPGKPILPGFAVLSMIFDVIQGTYNKKLMVSGLKKIRFKKIIKPGDRLVITAKTIKESRSMQMFSFNVSIKGVSACKGTIIADVLNKT